MKSIVVTYDKQGAIGRNGEVPWGDTMKSDEDRFHDMTDGDTVIIGRKTYEWLPEKFGSLSGRQRIVLSTMADVALGGAHVVGSLEEAYATAIHDDIHIIGGADTFKKAAHNVDIIYATEIDAVFEDSDLFFRHPSPDEWTIVKEESFRADSKNAHAFAFVTYLRRNRINRRNV